MVIVTGMASSGTSLVMETLRVLGYPIAGLPYPIGRDISLNKSPFWEIPTVYQGDLSSLQNGCFAIKVNLRKFAEKTYRLIENSDKIILCIRDFDKMSFSQFSKGYASSSIDRCKEQNIKWYSRFCNLSLINSILHIEYEEYIENKTEYKKKLLRFVK